MFLLAASVLNSPEAIGSFLIVLAGGVGAALVAFSRQRLNNSTLQSETLQAYEADRTLKTGQITELTRKIEDLEHRVTEHTERLARATAENAALKEQVRQMAPIDALARAVTEMREEINAGVVAICERMDDHKGSIEAVRNALT
jgi:uncharacterized protein HemX